MYVGTLEVNVRMGLGAFFRTSEAKACSEAKTRHLQSTTNAVGIFLGPFIVLLRFTVQISLTKL